MHPGRLLLLGGLLIALLSASCGPAAQGLTFRLTRDGAPSSYLIGTMHSADARVMALLDDIAPLIETVDVVAIEVLPDAITLLAVGAATLLPMGQSLHGLIGADRFAALGAAADRHGVPVGLLNRLKPWAAAVTLGMPAPDGGRFLDSEIYLHALARKRHAVGLETAAEQLEAFDDMAPDLQVALLDEVVKNISDLPTQLELLTSAYLEGDLERLDGLARAQYHDMPAALAQWFDEVLLEQRNARMLARMAGLMEAQSVLVAVGALHLVGDSGLLAGIERLGYRIERWPQ
jgi:uncharacterized protein